MRINSNKKYVFRIIIVIISMIMIGSIRHYLGEYDFPGVNGDQPTVFYTATSDDTSKKIDKHFKDDFERLGVQLYETKRTHSLVIYDVVATIEQSKEFHDYVAKDHSEFIKQAPLKSNSVADIKDNKQGEDFQYNERVGFRIVPAFNIPVIGTLASGLLNSALACALSIAALVLFIILFLFIPIKEDVEILEGTGK